MHANLSSSLNKYYQHLNSVKYLNSLNNWHLPTPYNFHNWHCRAYIYAPNLQNISYHGYKMHHKNHFLILKLWGFHRLCNVLNCLGTLNKTHHITRRPLRHCLGNNWNLHKYPGKIYQDSNKYHCNYCNFKVHCHHKSDKNRHILYRSYLIHLQISVI